VIGALVGWAFRRGVREGVVGGSGPWLVVAAVAGGFVAAVVGAWRFIRSAR